MFFASRTVNIPYVCKFLQSELVTSQLISPKHKPNHFTELDTHLYTGNKFSKYSGVLSLMFFYFFFEYFEQTYLFYLH